MIMPEAPVMKSSEEVEAKTVEAVSALLQEADLLSKQNPKAAMASLRRAVELSSQLAGRNASAVTEGSRTTGTDISSGSATGGRPLQNQEEALRLYEKGIFSLASLYAQEHDANAVRSLLRSSLDSFKLLPKARTAKLVRMVVDTVATIPSARDVLIDLCQECIEWCKQEKRAFLRVRLELKLAQVYVAAHRFTEASSLLTKLLHEVKKLDDKLLLVEVHLLDSELNFLLLYIPKSRAALTAARTNANAIHCPPTLQGQLDLQGGILHAYDRDFKTAYSYFFEAFEAFSAQELTHAAQRKHAAVSGTYSSVGKDERSLALQSLKYMLLSKVLMGRPDDVPAILSGKQGLRYYQQTTADSGSTAPAALQELEALRLLAVCYKKRSLKMLESVRDTHRAVFEDDPVLRHHTKELYDTLLEQNLCKILQAFSRVELEHVAKLIDLPVRRVESKLSEMMLDGKLLGTLDQGVGVLVLFEKQETPQLYTDVLGTVANMASVVDALYAKAQQTL